MSENQTDDQNKVERTNRLGLTEWLSIAQILALLAGGIWVGFIYLKFDARDKTIASEKAKIELNRLKCSPLNISPKIVISKFYPNSKKNKCLNISLQYSLANTTNQKIKVTSIVVKISVLQIKKPRVGEVVEISASSDPPDSPWRRVFTRTYLAEGESLDEETNKEDNKQTVEPEIDGGGTGEIEPKDRNWARVELLSNDQKATFIEAFIEAHVRLEDGTNRTLTVKMPARLLPGEYHPEGKSSASAVSAKEE